MPTGEKKTIKVSQLVFDSYNPRVPSLLQGNKKEDKIIEYMVKFGNVTDLMLSIAEIGYSDAEPLLVVEGDSEKYVVIEGNRRLAALKLLNNPELTDLRVKLIKEIIGNASVEIPTEVPCIVYENRKEILDYLGYRHITGVKDWGALEKARYLEQLYLTHIEEVGENEIYHKIAKMIGSRSDYVRKLHMALKLYDIANEEAYYGLEIKEKDIDFSWITTALGNRGILDYIGFEEGNISLNNLNKDNFEKVFVWLFDKEKQVVAESRQISTLAKVLASSEATEKLERGCTLAEALLYTSEPEEIFMNQLSGAKKQLQQAKMAIEQLSEKPQNADAILEDIDKLRKTIVGALYVNFNSKLEELKVSDVNSLKNISKEELLQILLGL